MEYFSLLMNMTFEAWADDAGREIERNEYLRQLTINTLSTTIFFNRVKNKVKNKKINYEKMTISNKSITLLFLGTYLD